MYIQLQYHYQDSNPASPNPQHNPYTEHAIPASECKSNVLLPEPSLEARKRIDGYLPTLFYGTMFLTSGEFDVYHVHLNRRTGPTFHSRLLCHMPTCLHSNSRITLAQLLRDSHLSLQLSHKNSSPPQNLFIVSQQCSLLTVEGCFFIQFFVPDGDVQLYFFTFPPLLQISLQM